jgi:uncharacterized membrane protein YkoI
VSTSTKNTRWKRYVAGGVLLAGLGTGAALAGNLLANAETTTSTATVATTTDTTTSGSTSPNRADETLLTGDIAAKVTAVAIAQYPGATIERVETDSDGVYEAHLTTADGNRVTVEIGSDFTVTGTEAGRSGGGKGHGGGGRGGSGETALTGDTATKVTDAALAAYPGATIDRVETDSDGVYEAHLTTAAGDKVTVEIGADFTVTGTETR